jgi:hypothetical protein
MMSKILVSTKWKVAEWLRQGVSPRHLALTLALGFTIGCIPVVGIPTPLCIMLALALRLNLPAIQAANYLAWPFQLVLIVPLTRLGGWLFASGPFQATKASAMLRLSPAKMISQIVSLTGHALVGWLVIAIPAVVLMTFAFTLLLRRVPGLVTVETGD